MGSELPEPLAFEYLDTSSESFAQLVQVRANRNDEFYTVPAGGVDVCSVRRPHPPRHPVIEDEVSHQGKLWKWQGEGPAAWHFITIDGAAGDTLSALAVMRKLELGRSRGFGSLKVRARIGESAWATSVFPDKVRGWLLPVKAAVRKAEGLVEGAVVEVVLEVL